MAIRDRNDNNWTNEFDEGNLVSNIIAAAIISDDVTLACVDAFDADSEIVFGVGERDDVIAKVELPAYVHDDEVIVVRVGRRIDTQESVVIAGPCEKVQSLSGAAVSDELPAYVPLPPILQDNFQIEIPSEGDA